MDFVLHVQLLLAPAVRSPAGRKLRSIFLLIISWSVRVIYPLRRGSLNWLSLSWNRNKRTGRSFGRKLRSYYVYRRKQIEYYSYKTFKLLLYRGSAGPPYVVWIMSKTHRLSGKTNTTLFYDRWNIISNKMM
jgi:hypothetical protein